MNAALEDFRAACDLPTSEPGLNWGCYFAAQILTQRAEPTSEQRDEILRRMRTACESGITIACEAKQAPPTQRDE